MMATNIAIACQGGGSHAAYSAGVLPTLLPQFANAALARSTGASARPDGHEALNLIGISGTSGGAITALLAWYGFLVGGAAAASQKLEAFWNSNCAQLPGEVLWNTASVGWANAIDYDLKFSPYRAPLRTIEACATRGWPAIAQVLGDFNHWMRADFFKLDELIRPHVDFDLVAALGAFCSIPQEIERWLGAELEARMVDAPSPRRQQLHDARQRIERRIEAKLAIARELQRALDSGPIPDDALLRLAIGRWREPRWAFEAGALRHLSDEVLRVTRELPQLLIGSVRIDDGGFTAFSSERPPEEGGISLAAVLASAALPWLFEAQEIRQFDPDRNEERVHAYWDGLFSQNPPIKNFMSGVADPAKKPDGIWVIQLNPEQFHAGPGNAAQGPDVLTGNAIWPTRDALSGNLSLNQEVAFVDAINRRIEADATGSGADDKHIAVHRIVMDGAAVAGTLGRPLGAASKFDRSARLKAALVAHGRAQGERFLALRSDVQKVTGSLGAILQQLAAPAGALATTPAVGLPALSAEPGVRDARLIVDGITVHHEAGADEADGPLASVRWHTLGAHLDGVEVRIEGNSGLYAEGADGASWRLCDMNVSGSGRAQHTESHR